MECPTWLFDSNGDSIMSYSINISTDKPPQHVCKIYPASWMFEADIRQLAARLRCIFPKPEFEISVSRTELVGKALDWEV